MMEINRQFIESKINELYYSGKMFYEWAEEYKRLHNSFIPADKWEKQFYLTNDLAKYLVLNSNLYLFYSINNLCSLLSPEQKDLSKKEISLFEHLNFIDESMKSVAEQQLLSLKEYYTSSNLNIIRNKIFAHKDLFTSGDPVTHFMQLINPEFFDKTFSLLELMQDYFNKYFNNRIMNNYLKGYYNNSHNIILDIIKNRLSIESN